MARGGWFYKPLIPSTASKYIRNELIETVLNTPYSLIYSFQHNELKNPNYMDTSNNIRPNANSDEMI